MEAATKDNDIEMARGTSAADQTMMASSSNNQGESFNSMGLEHYSAAAKGDFEKFEHSDSKALAKILTPNGNTILHIHITARPPPPRSSTSQIPEGDFVSRILGECPDLLWEDNKKGETLLHMAARHGHFDVVKYLLQECTKIPYKNQYDDQEHEITPTRRMLRKKSHKAKDTALHEAVRYSGDHLHVVKVLTRADPELTYEANTAGETPLYLAAERGYAKVLNEILITCSSPGDHGPYDRTALHVAVIRKDKDMVERLLQAREGIHKSKQDQHGWTSLHFAAHLGNIEILKKLLRKDNSVAYIADNNGKTALHVAAGQGRVDIMRVLISKCPDCCELVDERGRNVLHFALESRDKKAVNLVLENPLLGNLINDKDENGNTPFLHAASIEYYHLRHPKVDMQVFNHQNHNAKDIILGNNTTSLGLEVMLDRLEWLVKNSNRSPGLRMIVSENDNIGERMDNGNTVRSKSKEDGGEEDEGKSNNGKGKNIRIQNDLVAATLIATVTFTAGITVPGGFVADKGPDQGAAILTRNTAFGAFVILNTMSLYFSCQAVLHSLYESSFGHLLDTKTHSEQMRFRLLLIIYAMMAMIGAFLSGTCAVLHSNKNLAISACVMPFVMFGFIQLVINIKTQLLISRWTKLKLIQRLHVSGA